MSLFNEIVKRLGSPTWGGIGVLASTLLAIIALVRIRKSRSKPNPSQQQETLTPVPSTAALSFQDQGTTSSPWTSTPSRWAGSDDDDDPTGAVPDAFLPPSYWN